jgi:hypothetical protein
MVLTDARHPIDALPRLERHGDVGNPTRRYCVPEHQLLLATEGYVLSFRITDKLATSDAARSEHR